MTFSASSARRSCRTSPSSTSRRWSPGSTCSGFKARRRLSRLRSSRSPGIDERSWRAARRQRSTWTATDARRPRVADELDRSRTRWFNMVVGDGRYHFYGALDERTRASRTNGRHRPYRALEGGRKDARPREEIARERDRLARSTCALPTRRRRPSTTCSACRARSSRTSRSTSPTGDHRSSPAGGTSCASSARSRRATASSRTGLHVRLGTPRGRRGARRAPASPGRPAALRPGRAHRPPIVAPRKELSRALAAWTAAAGIGRHPESITRPDVDHALGRHDPARAGVGQRGGGRLARYGRGGVARYGRGPARVVINVEDLGEVRDGDVLVGLITSPAWALIFPKMTRRVTDIGGVMSARAIVRRVGTGPPRGGLAPDGRRRRSGRARRSGCRLLDPSSPCC